MYNHFNRSTPDMDESYVTHTRTLSFCLDDGGEVIADLEVGLSRKLEVKISTK